MPARFAAGVGASTDMQGTLVVEGGLAYFPTRTGVCQTDGTEAGTRCYPLAVRSLAGLKGKVYAIAGPWDEPGSLYELDGTHPPREVAPLPAGTFATDLMSTGKQLFYLSRRTISDGVRLMQTDGTVAGTKQAMLFPSDHGTMIAHAGNSVLFQIADTSVWKRDVFPRDLWMSNGTPDGTTLLQRSSLPAMLANVGGVLLYRSNAELWRTDGTAAGTFVIASSPSAGAVSVREPYAYFVSGGDLWRTDGTETTLLRHFEGSQSGGVAGSRLIAFSQSPGNVSVWAAGASGGAPELLVSIATANPSAPTIAHVGALAYFMVRANGPGYELWRTDGTVAGTYSLVHVARFSHLSALGERLVFFADDFVHGFEPWISDGTREGTKMIANLAPEGVVHGTVTDATTGTPIAGATLQAGDSIMHTDADGRYTIEGAIGTFALQALTATHIVETRLLTVHAHEDLTVDFALTPGGLIQGHLTNGSGSPLRGYVVTISAEDGSFGLAVITSADGGFSTPPLSTAVRWNVRASAQSSFYGAAQDGIALTAHETRTVDLAMVPFGRVRIRMVDSVTGGDIRTDRFGWVFVYGRDGNVTTWEPVHDSVVDFTLPDGDYQFVTGSEVYQNRWLDGESCTPQTCSSVSPSRRGKIVRVTRGTMTSTDFVTTPLGGSVRAIAVDDETGQRLHGIQVTIGEGSFRRSCVTDPFGQCETDPIYPDGLLTVIASPSGSYLQSATSLQMHIATDPRPQIKVRLTRGASLVGRVTDRTGRGVAGAQVRIADRVGSTDAAGYYNVSGLPGGSYSVIVQRDGYAAFATDAMLANGEKTTLDVTLRR